MKDRILENITKLSFISLATLPLLKENINSMVIICCVVLTLIHIVISKDLRSFKKKYIPLTLLFWMFLMHELFSLDLNFDHVLRYLPFLILPLLFFYRPIYIDERIKRISLIVFQASTFLQCFIYLFIFLKNNNIERLFNVSPENIPFFREYVFSNYYFEIHPTYFSAYLLVSITITLHQLFFKEKLNYLLAIVNMCVCISFIFIFSSKIIFIVLFVTIIVSLIFVFIKKSRKQSIAIILGAMILLAIFIYPSRYILKERFDEIRTEIEQPIIGDYYNSTNTRVAIIKCSIILLKEVPFFGFGDQLQEELDICYAETNKSDFYKKGVFNTHNYYINLILYGGWIFFFTFLAYIVFIFKNIKYSALGLFLLMQFLIINLTENYFSRHYGVVLFTYLMSLIIFINEKSKSTVNE